MGKVQIEIEIPDGHEVVDVIPDVSIYKDQPCANRYTIFSRPTNPFEICGEPSEWPKWLTWRWAAMTSLDEFIVCNSYTKPLVMVNDGEPICWDSSYGWQRLKGVSISIPGKWHQTLRENPHRQS